MGRVGLIAGVVACGALVLGGAVYLTRAPAKKGAAVVIHDEASEKTDFLQAETLLSQDKIGEALNIIHQYEGRFSVATETGRKWYGLLMDAYVKSGNIAQLMVLYDVYPKGFATNEKASIMVADGYILAKRPQDYQKIREEWREKATLIDMWTVLDADALLLEGKREEALKLLKANKFEGTKDIDRLVRLALIYSNENPKIAWEYLAQAYNLDPKNPVILTYRGKLLESMGQDSLALYEYLSAVQAAPNDLYLRDQVAELYMRRGQTGLALAVWLETLSRPSLDLIWIKALFWSKVVTPVVFDWAKAASPQGDEKPFIEYLASLPKGAFWDKDAFEKIPKSNSYLSHLQVTFWLRLAQALKNGDEKEARNLLQFNNFSQSLINPQLEAALKRMLNYRLSGSLNDESSRLKAKNKEIIDKAAEAKPLIGQTFFDQLSTFASNELQGDASQQLPKDIRELIASEEAFAAAFLAAGWLEAAIQLHKMPVYPDSFPEWPAYGMTQALRANRSPKEALDFALKQKKTPSLTLLIGELYLADKSPDLALKAIDPYLKEESELGYRASWLASLIYVEKGEYKRAKEVIEAQPKLSEDVLGKEGLARIALLEGNADLAVKLYSQLQDQSPEAMSYLARQAFAEKDWRRAQELTERLLILFPDNPVLRGNLQEIMQQQDAKKDH